MNLKIFYWTSVVYRFLPFIHLSPSRHLDFYFSSLPLEEKNTNKETESISYFPLSIISIFFSSFSPPFLHQESEYVSIADLPGYGMTGDIDIFDRIPICFRGILPCSRDENEKRERERRFLENVLEFQRVSRRCEWWLVVGFVFPQRGRIEKSEGGRAREVHSSLARCNVYILRLQPTLVTFYAPVTLPSLSTVLRTLGK